ncbi:MAG: glutathione S-transferase family protein, partial [Gammaproteobacteria bacterium]|nr:glutathione S-transferase family protein [Gammaproteobacteria bacterium]
TLKLLIALQELALPFSSRYLDTAQLEQWSADHRRIAPQGQVPVLVDAGEVMNDCAFALQYLAEAYTTPQLAPRSARLWYEVQAWNARVDAALAPAVSLLGWTQLTSSAERAAYRTALAQVSDRERPAGWFAVLADAEASEDQLANARERIDAMLTEIERALGDAPWLVGDEYSIADINAFANLHTLPRLLPASCRADATPRLLDWLARIGARPAVRAALATRCRPGQADAYAPPA